MYVMPWTPRTRGAIAMIIEGGRIQVRYHPTVRTMQLCSRARLWAHQSFDHRARLSCSERQEYARTTLHHPKLSCSKHQEHACPILHWYVIVRP